MPGLFGLVGAGQAAAGLLAGMAVELREAQDQQCELHEGEEFGFGCVRLAYQTPGDQLVWNEDKSTALVMHGEIYSSDHVPPGSRLQKPGELVLRLYEEKGTEFPKFLNGAFAVAIWDRRRKRLVLANDRLGLHPVYYCQTPHRFLFASGVRALLRDTEVKRKPDMVTVAQMLTFEHPLGQRTLIDGISLLPPGSVLTWGDRRTQVEQYWTLEFDESSEPRSEESCLEELYCLLKQAVDRQKSHLPSAVLLSGGMDSRVVLAFLTENRDREVQGLTFGIPGCTDGWMAREACAAVGVSHRFQPLNPDYLSKIADRGVKVTDGQENVLHMHSLAHLDSQAERVKVIYKGYFGGALSGNRLNRNLWAHYPPDVVIRHMFDDASTVFKQADHLNLLSTEMHKAVNGQVFETFREVFEESRDQLLANRFNKFDLGQRQRRFSLQGVEIVRNRVTVRTPWCDKDLVDFMLTLPPGWRLDRYLVKKMLSRYFPKLAKVPCTDTGFPLAPCLRDSFMRLDRQMRWRLRAAGLRWVPIKQRAPYTDYPTWFRTSLRGWVEEILLSRLSRERGYFNPGYVRQLVNEHMEGKDHSFRLGILITLELWHRQFLDRSPNTSEAVLTADATRDLSPV